MGSKGRVIMNRICPNCGVENEENSKFCKRCGAQLSISRNEIPKENNITATKGQNKPLKKKKTRLGGTSLVVMIAMIGIIILATIFGVSSTGGKRLIGSWEALSSEVEPATLQFLSEDRVLIQSDDNGQETTFDEYQYHLNGREQMVFVDDEGKSQNVFFELDINVTGFDTLRICYENGADILYTRIEEFE